jgi:hypothetical protein
MPVRVLSLVSFPKLEDIPIISTLYGMYKEAEADKKNKEMQKIGRSSL